MPVRCRPRALAAPASTRIGFFARKELLEGREPMTGTETRRSAVPLLDLKGQYHALKDELDAAVMRVIESQYFILGPEVSALEEEVAAHSGAQYGVGMSSGTDALLASLMALDVGPGDEVITSTFTFFATAGVIARLGARPVFVDIDPDTFNIDPAAAAEAFTPRTRALIPVHLYGRVANMDPILEAARARGVAVIEDAAQAIGASDTRGRRAGAIAEQGCFSFFPSKNLGGFGDGGMTVTSHPGIADRLRRLRMHGMEPKYYHSEVGGNFRLDALQAAVLRVKLKYLDTWSTARRRNAARYRALFAEAGAGPEVVMPSDEPGHIYNQFVVRVPRRDQLQGKLREEGIGTEVYYPVPLHLQACFAELGYRPGDMPHAEAAAREVLALPVYPELSDDQLVRVVEAIRDFFGTA
jgi:dTDP-4-amino-4,6-dideoxygalactose transaminase